MDEGSLLVYPELVLKGHVPYRDFETFYGPANLWVLSGTYAAFSCGILVERSVGLAYRVLILAAIFMITRRWGMPIAAGCVFLAGMFTLPTMLAAYAWTGAVMCALWSLWMIGASESKPRAICGGVLGAVALLFRPDLGPAVIASTLPLFLLMGFRCRRCYAAGVVAGLLPLLALMVVVGPQQLLNNLLLFPVVHANPGRHLPIFSADGYVICLFFIHLAAALTNIVAGAISVYSDRRDSGARLLLALGLFSLGLSHQAAQRLDILHVVFAASVSISILPVSIFSFLKWNRTAGSFTKDAILATAAVLLLIEGVVPEFGFHFRRQLVAALRNQLPKTVFVSEHGRSFPIAPPESALPLAKLLDRLDALATPGDRLFVGPGDLRRTNCSDTFIYYMMPRLRPASYFLEMNPGSANRPGSRLADDVASADWLVLDRVWDRSNEQNESTKYGSDLPMRVVRDQFELCGHYGALDLYRKRKTASL